MLIVDRVPRPKLIAGGMISCVIVLIVECILVARNPIGPDVNKSALKAAVAMIFCMFNRSDTHLYRQKLIRLDSVCGMLRVHEQCSIQCPWRDLSLPPSRKRDLPWRCRDLPPEHRLAPSGADGA